MHSEPITPAALNFRRLKTLKDFERMGAPQPICNSLLEHVEDVVPDSEQMVLRILVRPKYGNQFYIPPELEWLYSIIDELHSLDTSLTGISNKWGYVTVRSGVEANPDNEWHLDGSSLRTESIPERNYIWVSEYGMEYKTGCVKFPLGFDPVKHNLFPSIEYSLRDEPIQRLATKQWHLVHPFVFHRRNPQANDQHRTFIRITFTDIEIRDVNCTENSLLPTNAWGRDPVKSFRSKLL